MNLIPAGVYTIFALVDNGSWTQPNFTVPCDMLEEDVVSEIKRRTGAFITYGLGLDEYAEENDLSEFTLDHRR